MNAQETLMAYVTGLRRGASGKEPKARESNYLRGYQDGLRLINETIDVERGRLGISGPDTARMFAPQLMPPSDTREAAEKQGDSSAGVPRAVATNVEAFETADTRPMSIDDVDRAIAEDPMLGKFAKLRQLGALRAEVGEAPRVRSGAEIAHEFDETGRKVTPRAASSVTEADGSFHKPGTDAIAWSAPKNGATEHAPAAPASFDNHNARDGVRQLAAAYASPDFAVATDSSTPLPVVNETCPETTVPMVDATEAKCPHCSHVVRSPIKVTGTLTIAPHTKVRGK